MPAVPASDFNVAAPCPGAMGDHSMPPTPRGSYDADVSARGAVGASSGAAAVMWDAGPDLEDGFDSDAMESIASTPCPDAAAPGVECGAGWGGGWSGSHGADAPAGKAVGAPSAAQDDWLALDLPGSGPKASVPSLPSPTMEPWLEDPCFQSQAAEQGLGQTLPVSPAFWSGVELNLRRSMLAGEAEDWFKDSQLEFLLRQPSGGPQGAEVEGPVWMAGAEVPARIPDEDCGEGKVARVLLAEALGRPRARQRVADEDDEGESDDEWEPHKRRRQAL